MKPSSIEWPRFSASKEIEFESTEFSKEFHVKSPDRRWAFDVLSQATMEFLLALPQVHPGISALGRSWPTATINVQAGRLRVGPASD